jgi:hypothetical protein
VPSARFPAAAQAAEIGRIEAVLVREIDPGFVYRPAMGYEANLFELSGKGIHVTYATSGIDGRAHLHYKAKGVEKDFRGDQIQVADLPIGRLVSVAVMAVPDLKTEMFSLVLPHINLPAGQSEAPFTAVAIHSTLLTSIGGPRLVKGATSSYCSEDVSGVGYGSSPT